MNKTIKKLYENPGTPASFAGLKKFTKQIKSKRFTSKKIKETLTNIDSYTHHKPVRKIFKRRRIIVAERCHTMALDLCDMSNIKTENKNYTFLMTAIDAFSKKAFVAKMKNKSANETLRAFKEILRKFKYRPKKIHVDKGK